MWIKVEWQKSPITNKKVASQNKTLFSPRIEWQMIFGSKSYCIIFYHVRKDDIKIHWLIQYINPKNDSLISLEYNNNHLYYIPDIDDFILQGYNSYDKMGYKPFTYKSGLEEYNTIGKNNVKNAKNHIDKYVIHVFALNSELNKEIKSPSYFLDGEFLTKNFSKKIIDDARIIYLDKK